MNPRETFDSTHNLTTQVGVVAHMRATKSKADWDLRCDQVKKANSGYPAFWFTAINMSGVMGEVFARLEAA